MVWMLRYVLLILIIFLLLILGKLPFTPNKRCWLARKQKRFYLDDDINNFRKNFILTYKGAVFEGEKYLGTKVNAFDVISIIIWIQDAEALDGFNREDFRFIEQKIHEQYPLAKLDWKKPIHPLIHENGPS